MRSAIFLDRDGTLIEEVHFLRRLDQVRLLPGVPKALRDLRDGGFALVVLTNQSGVARGLLTEETSAIRRSLFLGQEPGGGWALCVAEKTHEDFDAKEVGRGITALMDMGALRSAINRAKAD